MIFCATLSEINHHCQIVTIRSLRRVRMIIAQSADDVQNIENAPGVSMGRYLLKSGQVCLLTTISISRLSG